MKKNAGNIKDPYLLSLSNLCMQMYQNSDGHRGLIPQFDNSSYTEYLSELEKDAWDGINQPGSAPTGLGPRQDPRGWHCPHRLMVRQCTDSREEDRLCDRGLPAEDKHCT